MVSRRRPVSPRLQVTATGRRSSSMESPKLQWVAAPLPPQRLAQLSRPLWLAVAADPSTGGISLVSPLTFCALRQCIYHASLPQLILSSFRHPPTASPASSPKHRLARSSPSLPPLSKSPLLRPRRWRQRLALEEHRRCPLKRLRFSKAEGRHRIPSPLLRLAPMPSAPQRSARRPLATYKHPPRPANRYFRPASAPPRLRLPLLFIPITARGSSPSVPPTTHSSHFTSNNSSSHASRHKLCNTTSTARTLRSALASRPSPAFGPIF